MPFVDPLAPARTVTDTGSVAKEVVAAALESLTPPRGPRFLDFPLDVLFNNADIDVPGGIEKDHGPAPDPGEIEKIVALLSKAERPIIVAGSAVWLEEADGDSENLRPSSRFPFS